MGPASAGAATLRPPGPRTEALRPPLGTCDLLFGAAPGIGAEVSLTVYVFSIKQR